MNTKLNIAILLFNQVEVLDFAGPFEVFSVASEIHNHQFFNVFTVSKENKIIKTVNNLQVIANHTFANHPKIDILIIPGGEGTKNLLLDTSLLQWIKTQHQTAQITMSICSGAILLAKLGLLKNKPYCTHHQVYPFVEKIDKTAIAKKNKRFVQIDSIYTSGGISAGIDLSFHILKKLTSQKIAQSTATYMEYNIQNFS